MKKTLFFLLLFPVFAFGQSPNETITFRDSIKGLFDLSQIALNPSKEAVLLRPYTPDNLTFNADGVEIFRIEFETKEFILNDEFPLDSSALKFFEYLEGYLDFYFSAR